MKRNTTTSALEWNQMLGLCDQLKKDGHYREYLLFLLGCHFGLRISDLLTLTWRNVLRQETVFIKEGKTGKQRVINVHERVQDAVSHCLPFMRKGTNWSVDRPIFANRWGQQISISYINKRIKWVLFRYRVKTQNASSHTLRKTFGRRLWEQHGESDRALVFLSEIFGHSNTATTRRYLGITQEEISNAYLSL